MALRRGGLIAVLMVATLTVASEPARALPFFDFETGNQGWSFNGPFRVMTTALGGTFAIDGFDGDSMSIDLDLTSIGAMTMETLFTGSNPTFLRQFVGVHVQPLDAAGAPAPFILVGTGTSLLADPNNPAPNPDLRLFDLSPFTGPHRVRVSWALLVCIPEDLTSCFPPNFPGFVDNIRFLPVPEPSSSVLISMVAILLLTRSRLCPRSHS